MERELGWDQCVCLSAAQSAARRHGLSHSDLSVLAIPESDPESEDTIDLAISLGDQLWSLEHTIVESYVDQIAHGQWLERLVEPVLAKLASEVPRGRYTLFFDTDAAKGLTGKRDIEPVQQKIMAAVLRLAESPELRQGQMTRVVRSGLVNLTANGMRLRVDYRPHVDPTATKAFMTWGRFTPDDLWESRAQRIQAALAKKIPKLLESARFRDAKSMLVLEDRDLALGTADAIQDAIDLSVFDRVPDEIYVVHTRPPPPVPILLFRGRERIPLPDSFLAEEPCAQCACVFESPPWERV